MIICSHWGMFPAQPVNANSANNFHGALQMAQLSQQANAINLMYQNFAQQGNLGHPWPGEDKA